MQCRCSCASILPETDEQKELLRSHRANVIPDPVYGDQPNVAIRGLDAEGHAHRIRGRAGGAARRTGRAAQADLFKVTEIAFGPLHPKAMLSPRIAPPMIGLGPDRGHPRSPPSAPMPIPTMPTTTAFPAAPMKRPWRITASCSDASAGRAGVPTIHDQSACAAAGDIGLSSSLVPKPHGDCTAAETRCTNAPNGTRTARRLRDR